MERVDQLAECIQQEDLSKYVQMCDQMIDWIRIRSFFAGEIVAKHYGVQPDIYTDMRDDAQDDDLGRTFIEKSDIAQVFMVPPKFKSLSKDLSSLANTQDTMDMIADVFTDVKEILNKYKNVIDIEAYKFQQFYYFLIKDRMMMKHSLDFNDLKHFVFQNRILEDENIATMISEFEDEATRLVFENRDD